MRWHVVKNKMMVLTGVIIACLSFIADYISKVYILKFFINSQHNLIITDFFQISLAWNKGVSFSLFDSYGMYGTYSLIALALIIIMALFVWLLRSDNMLLSCGIGFIIGGALGNVYDRIKYNAVLDFLLLHYKHFLWPVFNFADIFITFGAGLIIMESFINKKGKTNA